ncbi:MAG: hypothetical protein RJA59_1514, partial [Pseudomonadota bacterium]
MAKGKGKRPARKGPPSTSDVQVEDAALAALSR